MVRVKDCYKTIKKYHRFNVVWLDFTERKDDRHCFTRDSELYQPVSYTQLALTKIKTHYSRFRAQFYYVISYSSNALLGFTLT
jgi:hypothetical protein